MNVVTRSSLGRGVVFSLLCVVVEAKGQKIAPPCANAAQLSERTERICAEVLPLSGYIHYRQVNGSSCSCKCEALYPMTLSQLDSLRTDRAVRYGTRWKDFGKRIEGKVVRASPGPPLEVPEEDGPCSAEESISSSILLCAEERCEMDGALREALVAIAASGLEFEDIVDVLFNYNITGDDCTGQVWTSVTGTGVSGAYPTVEVPASLVRHDAVGEELLMFLLLHEIGHGVTRRAGDVLYCESDADAWAVMAGFNMVYADDFGDRITALIGQLNAYYAAIYPDAVVERPLISDGYHCLNDYPARDCRVTLIEMAAGSMSDPDLATIDELVDALMEEDSCWSGGTSDYSTRHDRSIDCDECDAGPKITVVGEPNDTLIASLVYPDMLKARYTLIQRTGTMLDRYEDLYCVRYAEKCIKAAIIATDTMRIPIPVPRPDDRELERIERRFIRALDRSNKRMEAVERRMLRSIPANGR